MKTDAVNSVKSINKLIWIFSHLDFMAATQTCVGVFVYGKELIVPQRGVLTLPVVPRDRWFICWVRGPIMLAGCMDIVWSMAGVITAPWWNEGKEKEMVRCRKEQKKGCINFPKVSPLTEDAKY